MKNSKLLGKRKYEKMSNLDTTENVSERQSQIDPDEDEDKRMKRYVHFYSKLLFF